MAANHPVTFGPAKSSKCMSTWLGKWNFHPFQSHIITQKNALQLRGSKSCTVVYCKRIKVPMKLKLGSLLTLVQVQQKKTRPVLKVKFWQKSQQTQLIRSKNTRRFSFEFGGGTDLVRFFVACVQRKSSNTAKLRIKRVWFNRGRLYIFNVQRSAFNGSAIK